MDEEELPCEQLKVPTLAVRARILTANFAAKAGPHRFGGAFSIEVSGATGVKPALHRVLTLAMSDPLLQFRIDGVAELPLVYGFVYDGCELKYRVVSAGKIEMLEMTPKAPAANWPYARYPPSFPEKRFGLRDEGKIDPEQVDELTWQGVTGMNPAKGVVAIVPPSKKYGVSLWGKVETTNWCR